MKNWFVFGGMSYYPIGGMQDFIASFSTQEEADAYVEENKDKYDWLEAVDITTFTT